MALKRLVVAVFLVSALVASQGESQLLGGLGILGKIYNISGIIGCSLNGNIIANATNPTPAFANAQVQLVCGGNMVSSTLTNENGVFAFFLNPILSILSTLLSSCNVVVATPLSRCNASLPATGNLISPLTLIGNTVFGLLNVANLVPSAFQLVN